MAQDIINVKTGEVMSGVPSISWPKAGGGRAKFIDAEAWSWLGVEPKLVDTIVSEKFTLDDTDYDEWTASTTAHTLHATVNATTFKADMTNHAYALRWRWQAKIKYAAGVTLKAIPEWECGEIIQLIFRRPNSLANIEAENYVGNATVSTRSPALTVYYNSSGTKTYAFSASYGFYGAATAPTFSSSTAASPTVTVKTPAFSCRCSSTYFATGRKPEIDSSTEISYICELYELPIECAETQMHRGLIDLYNNPLTIQTGA